MPGLVLGKVCMPYVKPIEVKFPSLIYCFSHHYLLLLHYIVNLEVNFLSSSVQSMPSDHQSQCSILSSMLQYLTIVHWHLTGCWCLYDYILCCIISFPYISCICRLILNNTWYILFLVACQEEVRLVDWISADVWLGDYLII